VVAEGLAEAVPEGPGQRLHRGHRIAEIEHGAEKLLLALLPFSMLLRVSAWATAATVQAPPSWAIRLKAVCRPCCAAERGWIGRIFMVAIAGAPMTQQQRRR
jgi:hypothetical protein